MELKEFIKNTLTQIADGVQEAINIADGNGYTICPTTLKTGKECTIHFDLAIESETEGGASIKVLTGSMKEKSANRVTFDVGMLLPSTKANPSKPRPTYDDALES
jgi:hypothetical protein